MAKFASNKKISSLVVLVLSLFGTAIFSIQASAAEGSKFKAGMIISDEVFYNGGDFTASQVQTFLASKLISCDTGGEEMKTYYYRQSTGEIRNYYFTGSTQVTTSRSLYGTRYNSFHSVDYASAPYICLKDYRQNTPSKPAETGLCDSMPARSNRSAAQIIAEVGSACNVNPKALIVLLQKEQGLVTDSWPWRNQYDKATGYACPDTAACDTAYYGFFNQVYSAARQFKRYAADPTNWNYVAGQNNRIYWQTNLGNFVNSSGNTNDPSRSGRSGCGYSWVYIQNQATAGLYNYTPYQPNQSALANINGTGDSCSAYGNRNFYRYFIDWFGNVEYPKIGVGISPDATPQASYGLRNDFTVTAVRADGTIVYRTGKSNGDWDSWKSMGTTWSQVTSGYDSDGKLHVFSVDQNGHLFYRYQKLGKWWSAWERIGVGISPDATPQASYGLRNDFTVTAVRADGTIVYRTGKSNGDWDSWKSMGTTWSQVTSGYDSDGKLHVFSVDQNGHLFYRYNGQ